MNTPNQESEQEMIEGNTETKPEIPATDKLSTIDTVEVTETPQTEEPPSPSEEIPEEPAAQAETLEEQPSPSAETPEEPAAQVEALEEQPSPSEEAPEEPAAEVEALVETHDADEEDEASADKPSADETQPGDAQRLEPESNLSTPVATNGATEPPVPADSEVGNTPDNESILNLKKGQYLSGTVKNITDFGVFVDLGLPQDGLVHISQMARHKVEKPVDVVNEGQEVDVWVKKVDKKRGRISLTMIRPIKLRLRDINTDDELKGVVTRLETYGAFVDIESERDGLVHISEITHEYIKHPEEALSVNDEVDIKVLKVDYKKRQVDLSIKSLLPPPPPKEEPKPAKDEKSNKGRSAKKVEQPAQEEEEMVTAMAVAFSMLGGGDVPAPRKSKKRHGSRRRSREMDDIVTRTLSSGQN